MTYDNGIDWPFDISALEVHSDTLPDYRARMDYISQWTRAYYNTME
jgi:hypothetical protein